MRNSEQLSNDICYLISDWWINYKKTLYITHNPVDTTDHATNHLKYRIKEYFHELDKDEPKSGLEAFCEDMQKKINEQIEESKPKFIVGQKVFAILPDNKIIYKVVCDLDVYDDNEVNYYLEGYDDFTFSEDDLFGSEFEIRAYFRKQLKDALSDFNHHLGEIKSKELYD